jgi:hypothetical protein
MAKRIHSFYEYLNEQEKKKEELPKQGSDAYNYAKTIFGGILNSKGFKDNDYSTIADTKETKGGLPYTGCGTEAYKFEPSDGTNKQFIDLFLTGQHSKGVEYAEITRQLSDPNNKKIFLLGVREKLEVKRIQGDKFIDKLAIIDPNKPTEKVVSYQITTCPSVPFYGDPNNTLNQSGVAIMQPGVTKYKVGIHRKGNPGEHEALVQSGEMVINRFDLNTKEIQTYAPGKADKGAEYGINIHRSSQQRGVCVGPWSAGCQVFADGADFQAFMNTIKSAAANNGEFLYVLMEKDKFQEAVPVAAAGKDPEKEKEMADEKDSEFASAADGIRNELGGEKSILNMKNSDEDKMISLYNGVVSTEEDKAKLASIYKKKFNVDIIEDMDRALSNGELKKLNLYKA